MSNVLVHSVGKKDSTHDDFVAEFDEKLPHYACLNLKYDTDEVPVRHLTKRFLIKWIPEGCAI